MQQWNIQKKKRKKTYMLYRFGCTSNLEDEKITIVINKSMVLKKQKKQCSFVFRLMMDGNNVVQLFGLLNNHDFSF
jgi:hypothetical protein